MWFWIGLAVLFVVGKIIDNSKKKSAHKFSPVNQSPPTVNRLPVTRNSTGFPRDAQHSAHVSVQDKTVAEIFAQNQQPKREIQHSDLKVFEDIYRIATAASKPAPVVDNKTMDPLVSDIQIQQCLKQAYIKRGITPQSDWIEKITGLERSVFEHIQAAFSPRTIAEVPYDDWLAAVILMKDQQVARLPFTTLFHMTHQTNVCGILSRGLLSHQSIAGYRDISDQKINQSRSRKSETVFKKSIHHYVPFYFNIKNAMLYRVQKENPDNIVILQMRRALCLLPGTVFSYHNAAARTAIFTSALSAVGEWDWKAVFSTEWAENEKIKQVMMSEMLIADGVDPLFIEVIHFPSVMAKSRFLAQCALQGCSVPARIALSVSPGRFFTLH